MCNTFHRYGVINKVTVLPGSDGLFKIGSKSIYVQSSVKTDNQWDMSYRNPPPVPRYNPRGSGNSPGYANEPLRLQTGHSHQHQYNGPGAGLGPGPVTGAAPPVPDKMSPVSPASRSPRYKDTTDAHNRYSLDSIYLSIYLYCVTLIAGYYAQSCLRGGKPGHISAFLGYACETTTHISSFLGYACETTMTGRRQPNHIHSDRFFFPYKYFVPG